MNGSTVDDELSGRADSGGPAVAALLEAREQPLRLPPELDDLITEAVVLPATAVARAEVVSAMLLRALDAVCWREDLLGGHREESSLRCVVEAAEAHRLRMSSPPDRVG